MLIDHSHTPPFVIYKQTSTNDCAFACLQMLCQYHQLPVRTDFAPYAHLFSAVGVSLLSFINIAEEFGFECHSKQGTFTELLALSPHQPFVALWRGVHLVVVYSITENLIKVADPRIGILGLNYQQFKYEWLLNKTEEGIIILFEKG